MLSMKVELLLFPGIIDRWFRVTSYMPERILTDGHLQEIRIIKYGSVGWQGFLFAKRPPEDQAERIPPIPNAPAVREHFLDLKVNPKKSKDTGTSLRSL